jgi:hypothetical protein
MAEVRDFTQSLRDSLFRGRGAGNLLGALAGGIASILLLSGEALTVKWTALVFAALLVIVLALLVADGAEKIADRFRWGLPVIVIIGFGLGALIYRYRSWFRWLWEQILRIDQWHERALVALFLLGAMLGAFIVRIWPKDQEAFIKGLSGILGGTLLTVVFVKMFDNVPDMAQRAFAIYALGFAISGTINLIGAAWLTANYTNKGSIRSRAVLDFLYGSERAEIIDKYFLKNFEEDPDYAKRWLTNTLLEFSQLVQNEFAERMEKRRSDRQKSGKKLEEKHEAKPGEKPEAWHYYELISFEHEPNKRKTDDTDGQLQGKEPQHKIIYRRLGDRRQTTGSETDSSVRGQIMKPEMFRVAVSIRQAEFLEYIVAPGEYHAAFPLSASVAGLALEMRQTIVMDRDRARKFRNKDYKDGISPEEREQSRGLDELDFLSYVCIPVVSRIGEASENALGILNVDTKIFCSPTKLEDESKPEEHGVFSIRLPRRRLTEMAALLYEDTDRHVEYLEELARVITPVLELFARCKVGAAKNPVV